jgi:hypothetical protein
MKRDYHDVKVGDVMRVKKCAIGSLKDCIGRTVQVVALPSEVRGLENVVMVKCEGRDYLAFAWDRGTDRRELKWIKPKGEKP